MSYRIAEVAELVGLPTTTLRYYEDIDLVPKPARDPNGYRRYDDADVARLRFATNAKDLGIPLEDVRQLVSAYEAEDCAAIAHRVAELVASRRAQAQARVEEMRVLAAQLQTVADRLADAPVGRSCGDDCPCATVSLETPSAAGRRVLPQARPAAAAEAPITCTLDATAVPDRVAAWQELMSASVGREPVAGGVAVTFPADAELAGRVAALAAAEQSCCAFFDFTVHIAGGGLRLEVRAPADATDAITTLLAHA